MTRHALRGTFIALAMLATLALVACGVRAAQQRSGASGDPQGIVTVELSGNAGTGYEWTCSNDAEDVLAPTGQETRDATDERDQVDGGPTIDTFSFEARQAGTAHLSFSYERPWEAADGPTFSCTLEVDDDLNVTMTEYTGPDEYRGCVKVS